MVCNTFLIGKTVSIILVFSAYFGVLFPSDASRGLHHNDCCLFVVSPVSLPDAIFLSNSMKQSSCKAINSVAN